jgi:hypothetical protein
MLAHSVGALPTGLERSYALKLDGLPRVLQRREHIIAIRGKVHYRVYPESTVRMKFSAEMWRGITCADESFIGRQY